MTKHMGPAKQALCYFYRNPPANSGVMPQPFKEIAKLIQQPRTPANTIRWVVRNFHRVRKVRGRRPGWHKTTPRNVIQLHLTSPAWEAGADIASEPVGPAELMRAWPVMEVVRFLEGRDLAGPAELLRRSGVNGADLLQLSQQDLCTDVLLTPFAARKVVAARDEFLNC